MSTQTNLAEFAQKFQLEALRLADCGGWTLSLRPIQTTLGAMVLSLRSGATNLADISLAEGSDMGAGFALAERLAREAYGAVRLNLLCLMMQDPVVHFHILPRYSRTVIRHGQTWQDADWPGPPVLRSQKVSDAVLQAIRSDLLLRLHRSTNLCA